MFKSVTTVFHLIILRMQLALFLRRQIGVKVHASHIRQPWPSSSAHIIINLNSFSILVMLRLFLLSHPNECYQAVFADGQFAKKLKADQWVLVAKGSLDFRSLCAAAKSITAHQNRNKISIGNSGSVDR